MTSPKLDFKQRMYRRVGLVVCLMLGINTYGTIGIFLIEDTTLFEAFYMSVITLTTVGFNEIVELSPEGRMFSVTTIYMGLAGSGVSIAIITNLLFEETLVDLFKGRRMEKKLSKLRDHFIVCGFGTTGRQITEELLAQNRTVVVIDQNRDLGFDNPKFLLLHGDARHDDMLEKARIQDAAGLAATLTEDADNVFVVLTARALNKDLSIASRYKDDDTESKLFTAGADHAVSPYRMGGHRLALSLITPAMVDLIDATLHDSSLKVRFNHVQVPEGAPIQGKLLKNSHIREYSLGALIVAVTDHTGHAVFNPSPDFRLDNITQLVVLGDDEQIRSLKSYLGETQA
ncbi:MAG: potassium channel protein [Acidobacteriota bacterium]|nr:potassium channel protein [Acidobacteriota bacterium]